MSEARNPLLDGVRGLAVLAVVLIHNFHFRPSSPAWQAANAVFSFGWIGVDLFFVLSGFLITGILLHARKAPHYFRNFYVRRSLRIFPAYYVYLLLIFVLLPLVTDRYGEPPSGHLWFYVYLQNVSVAWSGDLLAWPGAAHLWSVAVEEQFYLVWPVFVAYLSAPALMRLALALIGTAWLCKLALTLAGSWWFAIYTLPFTRMDGLAAGALIALLPHCGLELSRYVRAARAAFWLSLAALVAFAVQHRTLGLHAGAPVGAYTSLATILCSCGLLLAMQSGEGSGLRKFFCSAGMRFLGKYSYGLYLLHYGVLKLLKPTLMPILEANLHPQAAALACGVLISLLSLGCAVVMYHLMEEPLLRLKDRYTLSAAPSRA